MADNTEVLQQNCPACGTPVDVADAEPLALIACPSCGEKLRVARTFDHFTVVETLGVGGMGAVYKARDLRLERFVALKLLQKELSADPAEAARLEQEARATAAVNHPNVVQVYSSGTAHRQIYLVMELVDHGSLEDLMAQHGRLEEAQVLQAGIQVAKGLLAAQTKGLIHRDVKPANILFADADTAKIGDFGLAVAAGQRAEAQNEIWGTPYYVAPERLNNEPEDFRSDIYSLGATLFHALAGRPPIEGESTSAAELRQLKSQPPDLRTAAPNVSRPTARVINKMLAPDPAHRFASYEQLIGQLQRASALLAATGGASSRWRKFGIAAAVVALLVLGAYALKRGQTSSSDAAPNTAPNRENTAAFEKRLDDARRQMVEGKYEAATATLTRLRGDAAEQQPLANWVQLHIGLNALLQGKVAAAREAFQQLERAGMFSTAAADAPLARFFVDTGSKLAAAGPMRPDVAAGTAQKGLDALALFLFAIKNWQLAAFDDAAAIAEKFLAIEPPPPFDWVADYKIVARRLLDDHRIYRQVNELPRNPATAAELRETVDKLRAFEKQLQMRGALADQIAGNVKRLTAELRQREKAEKTLAEQEQTKTLEAETPVWEAALAEVQRRGAAYDFAGALGVLNNVTVTAPALREAQDGERKRLEWLLEWKRKLITDLNTGRFAGRISDIPDVEYQGAAGATDTMITLRIPSGRGSSAPVRWTQLQPRTLLAMSIAFIQPNAADVADRQWLAAAFAATTAQADAAQKLADAAVKTKPEYKKERALLRLPSS